MRATIKDVAKRAGVSTATVSSVMSGRRGVSATLRERVLQAVEELGYEPDAVAQSLRDRRTRTIGVSVPDITNPFFNGIVRVVDAEAFAAGYHTLLVSNDERADIERIRIGHLITRRVDGIIVVPTDDDVAYRDALVRLRLPAVFVDRGSPTLPFDVIGADDYRGGYDGARLLHGLGHRRIAALATSVRLHNIRQRLAGFDAAMNAAGVAEDDRIISILGLGDDDGVSGIVDVLRRDDAPTALFCFTNRVALYSLRAAHHLGLRVPTDLSILSFDDVDWLAAAQPPLSVVAQPLNELGRRAWVALHARIVGSTAPVERVSLACSVAVRGSTAPRRTTDAT